MPPPQATWWTRRRCPRAKGTAPDRRQSKVPAGRSGIRPRGERAPRPCHRARRQRPRRPAEPDPARQRARRGDDLRPLLRRPSPGGLRRLRSDHDRRRPRRGLDHRLLLHRPAPPRHRGRQQGTGRDGAAAGGRRGPLDRDEHRRAAARGDPADRRRAAAGAGRGGGGDRAGELGRGARTDRGAGRRPGDPRRGRGLRRPRDAGRRASAPRGPPRRARPPRPADRPRLRPGRSAPLAPPRLPGTPVGRPRAERRGLPLDVWRRGEAAFIDGPGARRLRETVDARWQSLAAGEAHGAIGPFVLLEVESTGGRRGGTRPSSASTPCAPAPRPPAAPLACVPTPTASSTSPTWSAKPRLLSRRFASAGPRPSPSRRSSLCCARGRTRRRTPPSRRRR